MQHGRVRRGYLGVGGSTGAISRRMALAFELAQSNAVRVQSVDAESPAAKAGLRTDDFIVGMDGVTIDSVDKLHQALDMNRILRDCVVKIIRGAMTPEVMYLTVRPTERAAD
jgi:S1-C subfamily serine protease